LPPAGRLRPSQVKHVALTRFQQPGIERLVGRAGRKSMLYTVAVILLVLWLLGLVSGYVVGNFVHLLLVVAVILVVLQLLNGRRGI
jgi:hypothetical protein